MESPEPEVNQADMKLRPHNAVTAILSSEGLRQALAGLEEAGVDMSTVDALSGTEGARILDRDGAHHGMGGRFVRWFQMMGSSENELVNYSAALTEGGAVVAVPVADENRADDVASILAGCGGERMLYFRSTAVERL
jgi:hypothetical protein